MEIQKNEIHKNFKKIMYFTYKVPFKKNGKIIPNDTNKMTPIYLFFSDNHKNIYDDRFFLNYILYIIKKKGKKSVKVYLEYFYKNEINEILKPQLDKIENESLKIKKIEDRLTVESIKNNKKIKISWADTIEKAKIVVELLKQEVDIDGWDDPEYKQSNNLLVNTIKRACWTPNLKFLKNIMNKNNKEYTYIFILAGNVHFKIFSEMLNSEIFSINI